MHRSAPFSTERPALWLDFCTRMLDRHMPRSSEEKTCKNQNAVQWTLRRIGRINTRHCSSEEMPTRIQPLSSENCAESRLPYLRRKNKQESSHNLSNDGPYLQRQLDSAGFCPFVLKTLSNSFNLSIMQAFGNGMAHLNRIGLRHPGQPLATVITSAHL